MVDSLSEDADEATEVPVPSAAPLVPLEQAESLLRDIAKNHKANGILRKLGHFRAGHLSNARASFARDMGDDETPLYLVDRSFLGNGKAGFLLTNRGIYSSYSSHPCWLADIEEISYGKPESSGVVMSILGVLFFFVLIVVQDRDARWLLGKLIAACVALEEVRRAFIAHRLLINGKLVCKRRLSEKFWIELLTKLAAAAKGDRLVLAAPKSAPTLVILETTIFAHEGIPIETRQIHDPSWEQIEQSIRELDQDSHPSLRIWAGEVNQAPALEILGGNGKYALRELGNGWVYYNPDGEAEEVEVCVSGSGYRCPGFYVCADPHRVLEVALRFTATGTPE